MNLLQVNTTDICGGAAKTAYSLHKAYQQRGHNSWLAVGFKQSNESTVVQIPGARCWPKYAKLLWRIYGRLQPWEARVPGMRVVRDLLGTCASGESLLMRIRGQENFNYPDSHYLLNLPPVYPDIVHLHNPHGGYFDLHYLIALSHQVPVVLTLHDAWLLSGHCAHSIGCEHWQVGCGHCPDLSIYPGLLRDGTAKNWQRKKIIYQQSHLYVVTPSHWLMDKVHDSMLRPEKSQVIPNGVNSEIFCPGNQNEARLRLELPVDAWILLYTGSVSVTDSFKDFNTLRRALLLLTTMDRPIILLCLGKELPSEQIGRVTIRFRAYEPDEDKVALYYQAANIYVHTAKAENYPYVILEAMACGLPVVASAVGGIPEQVLDGETGFLIPAGDHIACAQRINHLLETPTLRERMAIQASRVARQCFNLDLQVKSYLQWYSEVLSSWKAAHYEAI